MISPALYRFYSEHFPDTNIPIDSPEVFYALVAELSRLKRKKGAG